MIYFKGAHLEIAWLEDFLTLASTRVFAKAADARNISQSAFTRRIKNLEFWIGTPLFDRSVHPVALTSAGETFLKTAHATIDALTEARQEAKGVAKQKNEVLEFVALHSLAISFFPQWIGAIEKVHGPVKSRVTAVDLSGCVETILSGTGDFMLGFHHPAVHSLVEDPRYPSVTIARDTMIAVSAADAMGRPIHTLSPDADFLYLSHPADSFLGRITQMILKRENLYDKARFRYESSIAEALKYSCIEKMGICWIPRIVVKSEIESGLLVKVSEQRHETKLGIRLHRASEFGRAEVERFWSFSSAWAERTGMANLAEWDEPRVHFADSYDAVASDERGGCENHYAGHRSR